MMKYGILLTVFLLASCTTTVETEESVSDETADAVEAPISDNNVAVFDAGVSDIETSEEEASNEDLKSSFITADFITENFDGSIVGDVSLVDCTLSGGSQTQCYRFTVAPDATLDHEMGPWCPKNISDTANDGGIWPDDGKIYEVSGDFVENLAVFYNDDTWQLYNPTTGEINVTDTQVSCEGAAKPQVEEEYQNHCVECSLSYMDEIPNITYTIPMTPLVADSPEQIGGIGTGVAFNGIKFDASAPTSAILAANTIAPFDDCGGHINTNAGYHYHETTGCSKEIQVIENHESMIGLAFDGNMMFTQTDATDLDACGGHEVDGVYHYHVSETGTNAFLGCYVAEYGCASTDPDTVCDASTSTQRGGGGAGGDRPAGGPPTR